MLCQALLQLHHLLPHGRILGHRGCGITDLLGTNPGGDIGAVQEDLLSAFLIIGDRDVNVAHRLRHARLIRKGDSLVEAEQTDGTIHGTGIDVNIAEFSRYGLRNRRLAGTCRTIDGNTIWHNSLL